MANKNYISPVFMVSGGGDGSETGAGSGQGTIPPTGALTYPEWLAEIAFSNEGPVTEDGVNPDADYNGDGFVNEEDYNYYKEYM